MLDIVIALLTGIAIGTFTGITPGIHINTVTAILLANIAVFSSISPLALVAFVVALAIAHTILDFIPSILTGATDEESFLSVLPGHEMLKEGKGKEAILMVLIGAVTAIPLILAITPIFIKIVPKIFNGIKTIIPFILIFISLYTITRERKVWTALVVFISTGLLGFATLNLPVKEPLLPLLAGLFGGSGLIIEISQKIKIPKQEKINIKQINIPKKEYLKSMAGSVLSAPLCSFLPAIGSGQAATISSEIIPQSRKGFLMMLGTINIIVMVLSFATLQTIGKTRTGASVAVKQILNTLSTNNLWTIIFIAILTIIIASAVAIALTNLFIKLLEKINYKTISIVMFALLTISVIILSNPLGIVVFITSTAWGIFTILSNVKRINMMGVLLLPTIIIYLTNQI
ncbi:tripartite tricarboxylate transporter permease [Candidatus Pacearchaeota archaeon]|nr:tripartite tricarboxylate transporter permease [Candidatus Pacearchaeota archaeon]